LTLCRDRGDPAIKKPEAGVLLCRVKQNGETGDWMATDSNGNQLIVRRGAAGTLETRHAPNGDEDPDTIALQSPISDANAGAPGEADPSQT
jgi:hypothetical protein